MIKGDSISFKIKSKLLKSAFNYNTVNRIDDLSLKSIGIFRGPRLMMRSQVLHLHKRKSPT